MTPVQQKRRAILQARCIRKRAKKWKLSIAEVFDWWIKSGNAEKGHNREKEENDKIK